MMCMYTLTVHELTFCTCIIRVFWSDFKSFLLEVSDRGVLVRAETQYHSELTHTMQSTTCTVLRYRNKYAIQ